MEQVQMDSWKVLLKMNCIYLWLLFAPEFIERDCVCVIHIV